MIFKWGKKKDSQGEAGDSLEKEVAEQPAEETPVEETPVEEAPAEEAPTEETPAEEAPAEEAPAEEAPAEEVPAEETPVEEVPVEETPAPAKQRLWPFKKRARETEEAPAEEAPAEETPAEETPVEEVPAEPAQAEPQAQEEGQSLRPSHGKLRAWLSKMDAPEVEEKPEPSEEKTVEVEQQPQQEQEKPRIVEEAPRPPRKRTRPAEEAPRREEPRGQSLQSEIMDALKVFFSRVPRILAACGGFLAILILLIGLNGKVKKANELLEQLQPTTLPVAGEEVQQETAPQTQTQVNTPVQPMMAPLAQQDILVELGVENTENGPAVRTCVDMGGFYDVAVARVSYDENNCLTGARIDLREAQECIKVDVASFLGKYSHVEGTIQVTLALDEAVLAAMGEEEKPQYEWFCRTDSQDEWEALDQRVFMISDDQAKVTYLAEDLAKKLDSGEVAQLRLVCRRTNVKGGSLTLDITGISISRESLDEALSPAG